MDCKIECSGLWYILLAVLCLVVPLPWVLSALIAGLVHEAGHILAVILAKGSIHSVYIGAGGAIMESSPLNPPWELVSILAGPVCSFSLMMVCDIWPRIALCGLIQGLYNMLPIYPLDGGRVLACLTETLFRPDAAKKVCGLIKCITIFLIVTGSLWGGMRYNLGIAPILSSAIFLSTFLQGKISCKERQQAVQ